jgi:phage shock protein C
MEPENKPNYRRIYRSPDDRVIAGVCGGLGEYFTTDPVIIRLILVVLVLFGGSGIVLYLLAWLLIPIRPWDMKI